MSDREPVVVLIPVLDRPERVEPLLESLRASEGTVPLRPLFLCSPNDRHELRAVRAAGADAIIAPFKPGRGDYARKMNLGFQQTDETWVFLAADDVRFHPGWAEAATDPTLRARGFCVVGTNDMGNRRTVAGEHSTHTMVHRDYGECGTIDEDGKLLHEGYWHNYCDDEFVQTAKYRGAFHACRGSYVEHLHPVWGKGHDDATYRRGQEHFTDDGAYFRTRSHLWGWPQ